MSDPNQPNTAPVPLRFSAPRAQAERDLRDREFRHQEERKDNDLRRVIIRVVGVFLLVVSVLSGAIGTFADNSGTREWAQGIVTILIGGFVGFLTGRAVK